MQNASKKISKAKNSVIEVLLILLGVLLIILFLPIIINMVGNGAGNIMDNIQDKIDDKKQEKELEEIGYKLSFTPNFYKTQADIIYENLRYSWFDDDYDAVLAAIKTCVKNPIDFHELKKQYGERQLYIFNIPSGSPVNLETTLQKELSSDSYQEVKFYLATKSTQI